ncbi:MAG: META domain-containing protein [Hoeflea sp.]|uniref:META domain-containing protein n=1 Tax=Hoeflea sp. TaxID=1940281 RepID=UPI0032ECE527
MKTLIRSLVAFGMLLGAQAVAKAEQIVLQSVHSGKYVTVVNGRLAASAPNARRASMFDTVRLDGNRMAFRDLRTGTYLRAGVGKGAFLAPGSPHIRGWETFEVARLRGGAVALRSVQNGKYVRAGVGSRSHLAAVSPHARGWETFRIVSIRDLINGGNGNAGSGGPGLGDIAGTYRITHVAAENGFLVQLGRDLARQSSLSLSRGGDVRASVGCNGMSAKIRVRNGRMSTEGGVIGTKMFCPGQGVMAAERGVGRALTESRSVVRDGRTLIFKAADGAELMRLRG